MDFTLENHFQAGWVVGKIIPPTSQASASSRPEEPLLAVMKRAATYGHAVEGFLGSGLEYLSRLQASCRSRDQQSHNLACQGVYNSMLGMSGLSL